MSALQDELRKKYKTPQEAMQALGLDAAVLALGLDTVAALTTDPPVSEKQRRAMFAAAEGKSNLGIPEKVGKEFVGKDKAMKGAKDIAKVRVGDAMPKSAMDAMSAAMEKGAMDKKAWDEFCAKDWDPDEAEDEDKDEKAEKAEKKEEKAEDKKAKDSKKAMDAKGAKDKKAKDSEEDEPEEVNEGKKDVKQTDDKAKDKKAKDEKEDDKAMDKHAMDEAIEAGISKATTALEKSIHANYRARYEAADMVRPYIGEVNPMAFDSGDAIKVHALEKLGVKDVSDLPSKALDRILGYQRKAGAHPITHTGKDSLAMDSTTKSDALKYAPGLAKVTIGV